MSWITKYSWLLVGVCCPHLLLAQTRISWGPYLGGNLATIRERNVLYQDTQPVPAYVLGPHLGVGADLRFGKLAFQPRLLYSRRGYHYDLAQSAIGSREQYRLRLEYLEVPLPVVYTSGRERGFQVFGGPYLSVGIGGQEWFKTELKVNNTVYPSPEQHHRVRFGADLRRWDAGVTMGIGYRVGQLQAQLGYAVGLLNLLPEPGSSVRQNRAGQLSLAYLFPAN